MAEWLSADMYFINWKSYDQGRSQSLEAGSINGNSVGRAAKGNRGIHWGGPAGRPASPSGEPLDT